jgi:hypothetical protein
MIDSSKNSEDYILNWSLYVLVGITYAVLLDMIVLKITSNEKMNSQCDHSFEIEADPDKVCEELKQHAYRRLKYTSIMSLISFLISAYIIGKDLYPEYDCATLGIAVGSILVILSQLFFVVWDVSGSNYKIFILIGAIIVMFIAAPLSNSSKTE